MNEIKIIAFGKIAEIIGANQMTISFVKDTDELKKYLENKYTNLQQIKYAIAVNKQLISENKTLKPSEEIALLPAFSGG